VLSREEVARHASFPFLAKLVAGVAALQTGRRRRRREARGLTYQSDLVRNGAFLATSPRTGATIPSGDSLILPDRTVFYRFPDCPELLLGAANLGRGYPLTAVVLLPERLLVQIGERAWGVREDHVLAAEALLREPRWWPPERARALHLFTGDPSFAHHAWNQLPALETLLAQPRPWAERLEVAATFQPLGPLHELFPGLLDGPVPWESSAIPGAYNRPGALHVNAGGFLVTTSIRERIRALAERRCSEWRLQQARGLARDHAPVVWISVRTRNRTPTNQRDLVLSLCRRLLGAFERCAVILDGHTVPADFHANPSYDRADTRACVESDQAEIDAVVASLGASGLPRPGQAIVPACGLDMLDAVVLAHAADFSVCHHGTVQHKIGWLAAKPGVVHSNRRTLALNPARRIAEQCEAAPRPVYLPPHLVADEEQEASRDEEVRSRMFENYRIVDVEGAVDLVLERLRREWPPRGGRRLGGLGARLLRGARRLWPR
jgi:hypothetical protein